MRVAKGENVGEYAYGSLQCIKYKKQIYLLIGLNH